MNNPNSRNAIALPATKEQAPPSTVSPWPVFWVISVAVFLVSKDGTMFFSTLRALRAGFPQATAADFSWVLNVYTVVYAAMLIPSGGWANKHGRKKVFLVGVALFVAASHKTGRLRATGRLIHGGRRLATAEARIKDEQGKLYANATTTCFVFDVPAAG